MWQIEKTTKHCQNCTSTIEVGKNYFSALFHHSDSEPSRPDGRGSPKAAEQTCESRLVRQDFCANCWEKRTASGEEPPFSFWQTKISTPPEPPKTPRQVLLTFFDNLFIEPVARGDPVEILQTPLRRETPVESRQNSSRQESGGKEEQVDSATMLTVTADTKLKSQVKYLFALILLRKRLLKLKESVHKNDIRFLVFERVFDNKIYEIPEISISEQELISLRDEFSKLFEFRI